jgi:tetratricopeptide (TPR) repeat protein
MNRLWLLPVGVVVVLAAGLLWAGEGGPPRGDRGGRRMGPMADMIPEDVRALFDKTRRGEDLTQEERAQLDQFRAGMRERFQGMFGGPGNGGTPTRTRSPLVREKLNPVDAALHTIAEVQLKAQQYEEAVAALERILKSPDAAAVSAAHFNMATIYRRNLGQVDKAIAEYRKVQGPLAFRAWGEILATYEEVGGFDKAMATLEEILAGVQDKAVKVKLLNLIARAWDTHGQPAKSAAALERVVNLLPYPEAGGMKDLFAPSDTEWEKLPSAERPQFNYRPFDEAMPAQPAQPRNRPDRNAQRNPGEAAQP